MTNDEAPLSVYRMTGDDLVAEYQYLYDRFDRHTPNQKARFYYVNGEMKARGLEHGMPTPAARGHDDAWDGEIRDSRVTRITALHGFPVDFTVSNRCAIHTPQGPGLHEH